ncbi:hypothetical protein I3A86_23460 [Salmonella enterica]|nr:hypothetical protein [Salmonella enterica]
MISATQTRLVGQLVIKLDDLMGPRAMVPSSSAKFIADKGLTVKKSWIKHDNGGDVVYTAGIRLERDYISGSSVNNHPKFSETKNLKQATAISSDYKEEYSAFVLNLRAKTLIHEMTHRACNTKDHAYFDDDTETLSNQPVPPLANEREKWLDNADSYGWFCISLAGLP